MKTKEINLQQMELVPLTKDELINENGGSFIEWAAEKLAELAAKYAWDHRAEIQSAWQQGAKANYDAGTGKWTPVGAGF